MPPAAVAQAPAPVVSPHTQFQSVVGQVAPYREHAWTLPRDSPVITSWPFLQWDMGTPQQRASVTRSKVVGAILAGTRQPAPAQEAALRVMPLLTHEMTAVGGSEYVDDLYSVSAFDDVYPTLDDWIKKAPGFWSKLADPERMRLRAAVFQETENYASRQNSPPAELAFLMSTKIGALSVADVQSGGHPPATLALSRATIMLG